MSDEQNVPTDTAAHSEQIFTNASMAQSKQYTDDQIYVHGLAQQYLSRIEDDADKAKFVTYSRGLIAEVETMEEGAKVTKSGKYTYKQVFDLAFQTLYPEPKTEETQETPVTPVADVPASATPPPTTRTPGDIQVDEGEEMEGYDEKLGLKNYALLRNKLRKMTKTYKNVVTNADLMQAELDKV